MIIRPPAGELTILVPQETGYLDFGVDGCSVVHPALSAEGYAVFGECDAFGAARERHSCKLCGVAGGWVVRGGLAVGFVAGKRDNVSSFYSIQAMMVTNKLDEYFCIQWFVSSPYPVLLI